MNVDKREKLLEESERVLFPEMHRWFCKIAFVSEGHDRHIRTSTMMGYLYCLKSIKKYMDYAKMVPVDFMDPRIFDRFHEDLLQQPQLFSVSKEPRAIGQGVQANISTLLIIWLWEEMGFKYSKKDLPRRLRPSPKEPTIKYLKDEQVKAAVGKIKDIKEKAIVVFGYVTDARTIEFVRTKRWQVDLDKCVVWQLFNAKARKESYRHRDMVVIEPQLFKTVFEEYFRAYNLKPEDPLFPNEKSIREGKPEPMCKRAIQRVVCKLNNFGLVPWRITPRTLRKSCGSRMRGLGFLDDDRKVNIGHSPRDLERTTYSAEDVAERIKRRDKIYENLNRELYSSRGVEKCPKCGNLVEEGWEFCPSCTIQLMHRCIGCGEPVKESWKACPRCGTSTDAKPEDLKIREAERIIKEIARHDPNELLQLIRNAQKTTQSAVDNSQNKGEGEAGA